MPDLTAGALRIHYVDAPSTPRRPALVLLHGAGANHSVWLGQMKALRDRAWVVIPDLPSHGRSEEIPGLKIAEYARALVPFLEALVERLPFGSLGDQAESPEVAPGSLGDRAESTDSKHATLGNRAESSEVAPGSMGDQAESTELARGSRAATAGWGRSLVLAGHSMGGAIAMTIALERPELLCGLILVGSGAKLGVSPEILDGLQNSPAETQALIARSSFTLQADPRLIISTMRDLRGASVERTLADFRACNAFDLRSEAPRIDLPTLILCGREDRMTPPKYAVTLAEKMPHARAQIIEGAGHAVMIEASGAVSDAMAEFLAALPAS